MLRKGSNPVTNQCACSTHCEGTCLLFRIFVICYNNNDNIYMYKNYKS